MRILFFFLFLNLIALTTSSVSDSPHTHYDCQSCLQTEQHLWCNNTAGTDSFTSGQCFPKGSKGTCKHLLRKDTLQEIEACPNDEKSLSVIIDLGLKSVVNCKGCCSQFTSHIKGWCFLPGNVALCVYNEHNSVCGMYGGSFLILRDRCDDSWGRKLPVHDSEATEVTSCSECVDDGSRVWCVDRRGDGEAGCVPRDMAYLACSGATVYSKASLCPVSLGDFTNRREASPYNIKSVDCNSCVAQKDENNKGNYYWCTSKFQLMRINVCVHAESENEAKEKCKFGRVYKDCTGVREKDLNAVISNVADSCQECVNHLASGVMSWCVRIGFGRVTQLCIPSVHAELLCNGGENFIVCTHVTETYAKRIPSKRSIKLPHESAKILLKLSEPYFTRDSCLSYGASQISNKAVDEMLENYRGSVCKLGDRVWCTFADGARLCLKPEECTGAGVTASRNCISDNGGCRSCILEKEKRWCGGECLTTKECEKRNLTPSSDCVFGYGGCEECVKDQGMSWCVRPCSRSDNRCRVGVKDYICLPTERCTATGGSPIRNCASFGEADRFASLPEITYPLGGCKKCTDEGKLWCVVAAGTFCVDKKWASLMLVKNCSEPDCQTLSKPECYNDCDSSGVVQIGNIPRIPSESYEELADNIFDCLDDERNVWCISNDGHQSACVPKNLSFVICAGGKVYQTYPDHSLSRLDYETRIGPFNSIGKDFGLIPVLPHNTCSKCVSRVNSWCLRSSLGVVSAFCYPTKHADLLCNEKVKITDCNQIGAADRKESQLWLRDVMIMMKLSSLQQLRSPQLETD